MTKPEEVVIFDTETTGLLNPEASKLSGQPYIIELYACKVNSKFQIIDYIDTLIKPPVPISEKITEITGIDDFMVKDAPSFIECYDSIVEFFFGMRGVVAHNLPFDMGMLINELRRHDLEFQFPYPPDWICTVEKSFSFENKRMSLAKLYYLVTGNKIDNAHRAKSDVLPLVKCYEYLINKKMI